MGRFRKNKNFLGLRVDEHGKVSLHFPARDFEPDGKNQRNDL
jgi:hypothetical protein